MVNVVNVRRVADAIEQHSIPDLGFNMIEWYGHVDDLWPDKSGHNCSTVACIGGWTDVLFGEKIDQSSDFARDTLGIDDDDRDRLFFMIGADMPRSSVTPAQAVRTLRYLADTYEQTGVGIVDWDLPEA